MIGVIGLGVTLAIVAGFFAYIGRGKYMTVDDIRKAQKQLAAAPQNLDQFTVTIIEMWYPTKVVRRCIDESGKVLWTQTEPRLDRLV